MKINYLWVEPVAVTVTLTVRFIVVIAVVVVVVGVIVLQFLSYLWFKLKWQAEINVVA